MLKTVSFNPDFNKAADNQGSVEIAGIKLIMQ